ncbi:DUF5959 family protein [Streptomyces sp. MN3]
MRQGRGPGGGIRADSCGAWWPPDAAGSVNSPATRLHQTRGRPESLPNPERFISESTAVSVYDVTASQIYVIMPVAAPSDWIERHRALLVTVRNRLP